MTAADIKKQPVRPDCIAACLYFMCLPFTVVSTPFGSVLKLVSLPVAAFLLLRVLMGKSTFTLNYIHFSYTVYILYTVALLALYRSDRSIVATKDMLLGLLMLLMISMRVYNEREREWIESAWLVVGLVCIVAAVLSKEVISEREHRAVIRIFGFEEDQNHFCAYFIMPVLICVKRFLARRKWYPMYILMILLSFYAILKTGSRGGLIGIIAGLLVYIFIGIKSIQSKVWIVVISVLVGVFVFTVIVPRLPEDVRERYTVAAVQEDRGTGRFDIWEYLLQYTAKSPQRLLHGSGIFSTYDILYGAGFKNGVAHNTYIQILNDQGLIGLLLFFAIIVLCLLRNRGRQSLYSCAFVAILAFSMSLTFYVFKPYLNIMMMCAMTFDATLPENQLHAAWKGEQDV